jgi:predicted alpha/beta-hydrolase family hydrolase
MAKEPERLIVRVNENDSVTAFLYAASKKVRVGITLILGHGAGSNQLHPFMHLFASGLAERGFDAMTFNFVYMEQGRRVPDPKAKLEACYRAVIEAARAHNRLKGNRLVIGGKSMGGRIASQVAAESTGLTGLTRLSKDKQPSKEVRSKTDAGDERERGEGSGKGSRDDQEPGADDLAGLVFLGYPLHPPGKPEQLRDAHLPQIAAPMLFVQGSRDAFGTADELRSMIKRLHLPATLYAIEGGDHSLKVPKSSPIPQQEIYEAVMNRIAHWL